MCLICEFFWVRGIWTLDMDFNSTMAGGRLPEAVERQIRLLQLAGMAAAAREPLDVEELSRELGISAFGVRETVGYLEGVGLLFGGLGEGLIPILPLAGRQFLDRAGYVPREVLRFLPKFIDDLHGREAILQAGTMLVEEFRCRLLHGDAVDHAAQLVPQAFASAVDEKMAIDLFAAAVALMVRLSDGRPAGCLAEEIMAVGLLEDAKRCLQTRCELGELTEAEAASACGELAGIFELFEDDDVLDLFATREPDDAALSEGVQLRSRRTTVDQRVEGWFVPFSWTLPTGYIGG
jgi:hypothetical protein